MVVISLFSGPFCHGEEVAAEVAARLGFGLVDDHAVISGAASRYGISHEKLLRSMRGTPPFLNRLTREKEKCVAYLRVAYTEILAQDGLVFHGFASHLLVAPLKHVLRVGVAAPREYRLQQAERSGLREHAAEAQVSEQDEQAAAWTAHLHDRSPWDKTLYDMFLPMQSVTREEAVANIVEFARQPLLDYDDTARRALRNSRMAAEINVVLAENGHDVDVVCAEGVTTILIRRPALRPHRLEKTLRKLAQSVGGVTEVSVRPGPRFHQPRIYANIAEDAPAPILLVDDEVEFVQSLSERLRVRNIATAIAYDGEEAMARVETDAPEVMVLDLKMPGIDGLEVLRRVKKDHENTEVIILTGHGSDAEERLAYELGAFAYLRKPVDIEVLTKAMSAAYEKINASGGKPAT